MKKLLGFWLLIAASALAQHTGGGGGVPGTGSGGTCGANNIPCTNTANTFTVGPQTVNAAGAASTPAGSYTGAPFVGNATTSVPLIYENDGASAPADWSLTGTFFGANAPSGFTGDFLAFHLNGGTYLFKVGPDGTVTSKGSAVIGTANGLVWTSSTKLLAAANGTLRIESSSGTPGSLYTDLFSAAGTALPTCNSGTKGYQAVVSDATTPTYLGAYTSGGAVTAAVLCNGTGWVTH